MDNSVANRILEIKDRILADFNSGNWEEIALLTGATDLIVNHPRLLRSLAWGDEDYEGNVLQVLRRIADRNPAALGTIGEYIDKRFAVQSTYISAKPSQRRITFAPYVFQVPELTVESDLLAVMMPFAMEFDSAFDAIKRSASECDLHCLRADDIWEEVTIIQDIFNLIYRSSIVIVDFTNKNPNVMYETGIAHTLGKHVIPITQSLADIPFDIGHHRTLKYQSNNEGLATLTSELTKKLRQVSALNR